MTSAMRNDRHDLALELQPNSRTSKNSSETTSSLEERLQACALDDIIEKDGIGNCSNINTNEKTERVAITQHRFHTARRRCTSPPVAGSSRPGLQKKSYSDLASYKDVHMKILVEGKEVLDTCLQEKYCLNKVTKSPRETENHDREVTETRRSSQDNTKKPMKILTGWLARKTQSKASASEKAREPPIGFRTLKRSKSFSGRMKDKIRSINPINGSNSGSPTKSKHLQPPLFYRIIDLNDEDNAIRGGSFRRRHSDQTDSMSRNPLGSNRQPPRYYSMSLERGFRPRAESTKKPLTRKKSNSLEKVCEFPFWSQISDGDRSRSCSARIRVSETHLDGDGTLETNLCSTDL